MMLRPQPREAARTGLDVAFVTFDFGGFEAAAIRTKAAGFRITRITIVKALCPRRSQ